jgi:hypothetical protein
MLAAEREAAARGCTQIVLETHDFQAPGFCLGLGFAIVGVIDDYPRGRRYMTSRKPIGP